MSATLSAWLWAAACMAITVAARSFRRISPQAHACTALPWLLRSAQRLGRHAMPCAWLSRFERQWPALWRSVEQMLRLSGFAPAVMATDWIHVLFGASIAGSLAALIAAAGSAGWLTAVASAFVGAAVAITFAQHWLAQQRLLRERALLRELPVGLDLLALSLECGCGLSVALELATEHLPPGALSQLLLKLQHDLATGRARVDALKRLFDSQRGSVIVPTLGALLQAEASGSSLAPVLRSQARQRTEERFAAAEKAALQAPVRMLLPLITCIFPCTFIVIAFPLAMRFLAQRP